MKVKKIKSDSIILHKNSQVKLKTCGICLDIQFTAGVNTKCPIQNISKDKYFDKETGEMKDRVHNVDRCQSPKSMRKSIKKLMDLIRCNAVDSSKCKWLTFTYGEVMTAHKQVFEDGKMFLRCLQRYLDKQSNLSDRQKKFKRITVAEPQGEGHGNSWHLHLMLIFEDSAPYLANEVIAKLWGFGITNTHKVYDADGLALYFKAYLSDVEYIAGDGENDSGVNTEEKMVDGMSKQFIKGERLKYYPIGMPLFSSSRRMHRPIVEKMSNQEAEERVSDCKMVYRETFAIGEEECGNIVDKRYYKKR